MPPSVQIHGEEIHRKVMLMTVSECVNAFLLKTLNLNKHLVESVMKGLNLQRFPVYSLTHCYYMTV